jgi:hypothetical protein
VPVGSIVDVGGIGEGVEVLGLAVGISVARGEAQATNKSIKNRDVQR